MAVRLFKEKHALAIREALRPGDGDAVDTAAVGKALLSELGATRELALAEQAIDARANLKGALGKYAAARVEASERVAKSMVERKKELSKAKYGFSASKIEKLSIAYAASLMEAEDALLGILYPDVADSKGKTIDKVRQNLAHSVSTISE